MRSAVSSSSVRGLWGDRRGFAYLVTYVASHAGIFELIFADLLFKRIFADSGSQPFPFPPAFFFFEGGGEGGGVCVSIGSGEYFQLNSFSVTVPVGGCMQGGGVPLAGLTWIPPCYA